MLVSQSVSNVAEIEEIGFRNYEEDQSDTSRIIKVQNSLIAQKKLFPKLDKLDLSDTDFNKTRSVLSLNSNIMRDRNGNPIEYCIPLPLIAKKPKYTISLKAPPLKGLDTKLNYFDGLEGIERQFKNDPAFREGNYINDILKNQKRKRELIRERGNMERLKELKNGQGEFLVNKVLLEKIDLPF